ncbi:MAG: isochorismate synthase [candidate division Zixibacteria bacterium]|nr:isochorismate synthase [candidate division Zixibacteria bacterium]
MTISYEVSITLNENKLMQLAAMAAENRLTLPYLTTVSIPPIDIPAWLATRLNAHKYYWSDRAGKIEIGGVGIALKLHPDGKTSSLSRVQQISALCADDRLLFLSSRRFDSERDSDPIWDAFDPGCAVIPEIMIVRTGDDYCFYHCVGISPGTDINAVRATFELVSTSDRSNAETQSVACGFRPVNVVSFPNLTRWREHVRSVLREIDDGRLGKVVLARRTDYPFSDPIDAWSLFLMLRKHYSDSYAIFHQVRPGESFMSFTPERLYRRENRTIAVDALSSTVPRGGTPDEDRQFENQLRGDDKQNREHRFVVDGVSGMLNPLCRETPRVGETSVMKLSRIQHLWTPITGILKDEIGDDRLLDTLHPTPAMGGTPRREAMEMIRQLEPFDRGLFAAPWGFASGAGAEYAAAIRSALVVDDVVSVFAGAGIVAGSDPDQEWRELDSKDILRPFIAEGKAS